jgi:tetratricopeptide (TPR) repeat protein
VSDQAGLDAHLAQAIALHQVGDLTGAAALYQELLNAYPTHPDLWNLLGVVAHQQNDNEMAVNLISQAIVLQGDIAEYHNNLGLAQRGLNDADEAGAAWRNALLLDPSHVKAAANLASLLRWAGRFDEALAIAQQGAAAGPQDVDALNNLGNALKDSGRIDEAIDVYRRVIKLAPDFALAHWNLSLALLAVGDYGDGFKEMSWRWQWAGFPGRRRDFDQPVWDGNTEVGATVLAYGEQGLGDTIFALRFGKAARALGVRLIAQLPDGLIPLTDEAVADEIIAETTTPPAFDAHFALMDLPGLLDITPEKMDDEEPYLLADETAVADWRTRLAETGGDNRTVGLNWRGNMANPVEKFRRLPMDAMARLGEAEGITWVSLQKGEPAPEGEMLPAGLDIVDTGPAPLSETAALIEALDLLITTDTAVAHLAGALGKPVWVLLHHAPDWKWGLTGETTPWYPTARLFRQASAGDWESVITDVLAAMPPAKPTSK